MTQGSSNPGTVLLEQENAKAVIGKSKPISPAFHIFETIQGPHILIPDGTRIYGLSNLKYEELQNLILMDDLSRTHQFIKENNLHSLGRIDDTTIQEPPLTALSLAIAQKCNLGCTYCYAQQGDFGEKSKNMSLQTAIDSIEFLFKNNRDSNKMNIAFMGGEPLINRSVMMEATKHAYQLAKSEGKNISFSITTNGTLVRPEDGDFFEQYGFAVTISLDGIGGVHDRLRPFKGGNGSYEKIISNVVPLLAKQKKMQVSARVSVTHSNLQIRETFDELIKLNFHSVGFSPILSSPGGRAEMNEADLEEMLENMIDCGHEFEKNIMIGKRYPFSNMSIALQELYRGTHRPYPCGAGAGYLGVSANGELAACHRFIEDEKGYFGDLNSGISKERQQTWLSDRHVHRQEPCKSCWARYLCGGGCHHEVIHRGRPACDYIRGWLTYVLKAYTRILDTRPDYFFGNK